MATPHSTEATQTVMQAAKQLAGIDFDLLNQDTAREVSPLVEALVNMLMIVYYQAETGQATHRDFAQASRMVRRSLQIV